MRVLVLSLMLAPYCWLAWRDHRYHRCLRAVPRLENLVHACLAVTLTVTVANAFAGRHAPMVAALVAFAGLGLIDELVYHRALPAEESDVHAKEHLLLFSFLVLVLALDLLAVKVHSLAPLGPEGP